MSIVPPTTRTYRQAGPFDHAAAMSRCDGCPECVYNYEPPRAVAATDDGDGFYAGYHCTDCGHAWMTAWGAA